MGANILSRAGKALGRLFGYDAAEDRDRRKVPKVRTGTEDSVLPVKKRDKLTANARDLNRNMSTVAWMIRRHLDYVAAFEFQGRSGDDDIDNALEKWMTSASKRESFDVAGRHRRERFVRIAEIRRICDGDFGLMRVKGGYCQAIEGDRIRNPDRAGDEWAHGVRSNAFGRALAYGIHRRQKNSFEFQQEVKADNLFLHGAFDRFDQGRGISPLVSALNDFRDVYEARELTLAKLKVTQMFALAFYRDAKESAGVVERVYEPEEGSEGEEAVDRRTKYGVDFGKGPVLLDLDDHDRAEFLESKHPSMEAQAFFQMITMVALKSLDIPYSFSNAALDLVIIQFTIRDPTYTYVHRL